MERNCIDMVRSSEREEPLARKGVRRRKGRGGRGR